MKIKILTIELIEVICNIITNELVYAYYKVISCDNVDIMLLYVFYVKLIYIVFQWFKINEISYILYKSNYTVFQWFENS